MNPLIAIAIAIGVSESLVERFRVDETDAELLAEIRREISRRISPTRVVTMEWTKPFEPGEAASWDIVIGLHPDDVETLLIRTRRKEVLPPLTDEMVIWDLRYEPSLADLTNYFTNILAYEKDILEAWNARDLNWLQSISGRGELRSNAVQWHDPNWPDAHKGNVIPYWILPMWTDEYLEAAFALQIQFPEGFTREDVDEYLRAHNTPDQRDWLDAETLHWALNEARDQIRENP